MIDSNSTESRTLEKLRREAEPFMKYLGDGDTTDILLNPDGKMWVKSLQHGKRVVGTLRSTQAESLARTIATYYRTTITDKDPILERAFPLGNARIEVILNPLADGPVIAIRCKASQLYTLNDYVRDGILTEKQKEVLQAAVESRKISWWLAGPAAGKPRSPMRLSMTSYEFIPITGWLSWKIPPKSSAERKIVFLCALRTMWT